MKETARRSGLHRVLIASDLSPRAEKALARAGHIAGEHKAALTVLHVIEDAWDDGAQAKRIAAKSKLDVGQKIKALSLPRGRSVTIDILAGKPFVEIIRRAREQSADVIVVGAHGADFIKDFFFGTTAEKIVRKGDRPVLVVKRPTRGPYRRVLVSVDFSEESRQALELALQLAPQAEFHILHVYPGFEAQLRRGGVSNGEMMRYRQRLAKEARQEMDVFLRNVDSRGKALKPLLEHGRAPHVIMRAARNLHADLVSLGTVGRTGLPYILLGSVAEHVLREVSCDVLVVRSGSIRFELP